MNQENKLKEHLIKLLEGGDAHKRFGEVVKSFPSEYMNSKAPNFPYTFWHLLEHIRIAQWDILEYIRNPEHESPSWPDGYWPGENQKADTSVWKRTVTQIVHDLEVLKELVKDPGTDLSSPLPESSEHNILREILIVADHNAYHLGEFAVLRRVVIGKNLPL
ncbi:MAG: DinB family protein [Spirochaetota bacterium]